ncbi:LOW QUALITY PROTEIN: hypothetical protein CRUP_033999 [Coryphaenoides rupestris]|nr:LOW QUALITY PROTEIN: hypothetical protein CRUP_033999 [Coryphaenoides rupestris]
MATELGTPLFVAAAGGGGGLRAEVSVGCSAPSLGRLYWLTRDSSRVSSVVTALPPWWSSLHSLLSSHSDGWLAVRFSSLSLRSRRGMMRERARDIRVVTPSLVMGSPSPGAVRPLR